MVKHFPKIYFFGEDSFQSALQSALLYFVLVARRPALLELISNYGYVKGRTSRKERLESETEPTEILQHITIHAYNALMNAVQYSILQMRTVRPY